MLTKNRITLLFLSFLLISVAEITAARHGSGQTSGPANGTRMKVLRKKDQLHIKPTALEIASNQNKFQEGVASSPKEERELEDKIPRHVPIRIKIREEKEKAFKDLTNEHWARDLELEVKNTGTKPIYFLVLVLDLPEVRVGNGNIVFALRYGRVALNAFEEKLELAKPEDVPIKPGDTYIFRLAQNRVEAWEHFMLKEKRPQPKKILINFLELNFGDGTGFRNREGIPLQRV